MAAVGLAAVYFACAICGAFALGLPNHYSPIEPVAVPTSAITVTATPAQPYPSPAQ